MDSNINVIEEIQPLATIQYEQNLEGNELTFINTTGTTLYQFRYVINDEIKVQRPILRKNAHVSFYYNPRIQNQFIVYHFYKNKELNTIYIFHIGILQN